MGGGGDRTIEDAEVVCPDDESRPGDADVQRLIPHELAVLLRPAVR